MSNFLKVLTSVAALVLFAMTLSEMASAPDPPPLLLWTIEQFNAATTSLAPFWDQARQLEEPADLFSFDYLVHFLLRGGWHVWKIWLIGSVALGLAAGLFCWIDQGYYDSEVALWAAATFTYVVTTKGLLIAARYIWLLVEFLAG